jgi:hypothetical protein
MTSYEQASSPKFLISFNVVSTHPPFRGDQGL